MSSSATLASLVRRFFICRLLVPLLVLVVCCAGVLLGWRIHQLYQAHYLFAKGLDRYLTSWMSQANQTLRLLAWEREETNMGLREIQIHTGYFHRIAFTRTRAIENPYQAGQNHGQLLPGIPLSLFPNKNEWPIISVPYFSEEHDTLTLGILVHADRWTAFGELKLNLFYRLVSGYSDQAPTKTVIITDPYGNVIYHPDQIKIRQRENLSHEPLIRKALRYIQPMELYGELNETLYYATSWRVGPWGWVIVVGEPLLSALKPVVFATFGATGFVLMLVGFVVGMFRSRLNEAVVRPISLFGEIMEGMAKQVDDTAPLPEFPPAPFKELDQFQSKFEQMHRAIVIRQNALIAQGQELNRILESIGDAVLVTDVHGRIQRMNRAAEALTGWNRLQAMGRFLPTVAPTYDPQTGAPVSDFVSRALSSEAPHKETRHLILKTVEGTKLHVEEKAAPLRDEFGKIQGVVVVFFDVSENYAARRLLEESEQKFRTLSEMSPAAVLMYQDDVWIYANPAAEAITGYTEQELQGRLLWELAHPEYREVVKERARARQEGRMGKSSYEFKIVTKSGKERWIYLFGDTIQFRGKRAGILAGLDITEYKLAQQALAESEQKYREIMESMEEAYVELDTNRRITFHNAALLRLLDCKAEDIQRLSVRKFMDSENVERLRAFLDDVWVHDKSKALGDFVVQDLSGHRKIVEISAAVRRNKEGEKAGFRILARDITEKVEAEEKTRSLERMLIQAQKMESLGTLASGIAHEFNNLLQAMSGYLELILLKTTEEDPRKGWILRVQQATQRAEDLIRRLLAFARPNDPKLEDTDINQVIDDALLILQKSIPRMIEIRKEFAPDLPSVVVDRLQMEQVFINLVTNSRDAIEEDGPGLIHIRTQREINGDGREWVSITFSDTGKGMTEEVRQQIFDPFFTTKEPGKGTGLGLSTVYSIIRRHGGSIECESTPGKGTTFTIRLPVRHGIHPSAAHPKSRASAPSPAPGPGKGRTILVVDDEESILEFVQTILEAEGYRVCTALSGEEALETMNREKMGIDCIILDLNMPGIGGKRCLEEIRKRDRRLPVVIASGCPAAPGLPKTKMAPSTVHLPKPYRADELLAVIRQMLNDSNR